MKDVKKQKQDQVRKHRGNPHGNPPSNGPAGPGKLNSDDHLRQEVGKHHISKSDRLKQ